VGCGEKSEVRPELSAPEPAPEPEPEVVPAEAAAETAVLKGPLIEYLPEGLSPLYRGFMADPQAIALLRTSLVGHMDSPIATLKVVWDQPQQHGTITLHVSEQEKRFEPLADAVEAGASLPMDEVRPLLMAVGAYRADLGARFDLRLLSFSIRLSWWDPASGSHCTLSGVLNDPVGERMSPCFSCVHVGADELKVCRTEDGVTGSAAARSMLADALRSGL